MQQYMPARIGTMRLQNVGEGVGGGGRGGGTSLHETVTATCDSYIVITNTNESSFAMHMARPEASSN